MKDGANLCTLVERKLEASFLAYMGECKQRGNTPLWMLVLRMLKIVHGNMHSLICPISIRVQSCVQLNPTLFLNFPLQEPPTFVRANANSEWMEIVVYFEYVAIEVAKAALGVFYHLSLCYVCSRTVPVFEFPIFIHESFYLVKKPSAIFVILRTGLPPIRM